MSTDKPLHRPVTRYTIARIIYDEGAYCGECEYEGWKFCSECRRTVLRRDRSLGWSHVGSDSPHELSRIERECT